MTVSTSDYFTDWVDSDGVNKDFSYDFVVYLAADMNVVVRDNATGIETTYTSGFTLTPTQSDFSAGFITFPSSGPALAEGFSVRLVRELEYTQTTEIGREGSFNPQLHERALDRLTMMVQQTSSFGPRAVLAPLGEAGYTLASGINNDHVLKLIDGLIGEGPSVAEIEEAAAAATNALVYSVAAAEMAEQAQYWAGVAQNAAAGVLTFNGRSGGVVSELGDYTSSLVTHGGNPLTDKLTALDNADTAATAAIALKADKLQPFATLASAATVNIGAQASENILVTGTTTITSFGAGTAGQKKRVRFASSLTLTYNATSIILPGDTNIAVGSDDVIELISLGGSNWFVSDINFADESRARAWLGINTSLIGTLTAGLSAGGVGSYAHAYPINDASNSFGATEPGSNLRPSSVGGDGTSGSGNLSGTWRQMGSGNKNSIWLRIS